MLIGAHSVLFEMVSSVNRFKVLASVFKLENAFHKLLRNDVSGCTAS